MKKNILKVVAIVFFGNILFTACKKDDDGPVIPDKVKKLMYDWKITGISVPKSGNPNSDSSILKDCTTDDVIKFNNQGYDFQDGTTKCDSTIFPYSKGAWTFDTNQDSIKLGATNPTKYLSWKVLTLNDSILKVKYVDSTNPANKLTKTISFKH